MHYAYMKQIMQYMNGEEAMPMHACDMNKEKRG